MGYARKYIFPALYKEDLLFPYHWKVPDSTANQAVMNDWTLKLLGCFTHKEGDFDETNINWYM